MPPLPRRVAEGAERTCSSEKKVRKKVPAAVAPVCFTPPSQDRREIERQLRVKLGEE